MRRDIAATATTAAIALAVALLPCACASPLAQGEAQFKEGRYPDAEETFASLEARAATWSATSSGTSSATSTSGRDRAEYLLYRGLTYGAVGDRDRARAWLRQAQALEDAHPGLLLPDDARRMNVALAADPASD